MAAAQGNVQRKSVFFCLWRLHGKYAALDHASWQTIKGLHTSAGKKLTTSDLIKRLQLAKGSISKTSAPNAALSAVDDWSMADGKVHDSRPMMDNLEKESKSDGNAVKKTLSKLSSRRAVGVDFAKKESFPKRQDRQTVSGEAFQGRQQRNPNQKHRIPVLHLDNLLNDETEACSKSRASEGAKLGNQQRHLDQNLCAQVLPSRGNKAIASGSAKRKGLLTTAFEAVPSSTKVGDFDRPAGNASLHGEGAGIACGENGSVTRLASRKLTQDWCKNDEAGELAGEQNFLDKMPPNSRSQPTEMFKRSAGSRQFNPQGYTSRNSNRFQTRVRANGPSLQFQTETESMLSESSAKQGPEHGNVEELSTKQHACRQEEAIVPSEERKSFSLSDQENSTIPCYGSDCLKNSQLTQQDRVTTFEPTGRSSNLESQCERKSMHFEERNSLNPTEKQHQVFGEHNSPTEDEVSHGSKVTYESSFSCKTIRDSAGENGETTLQPLGVKTYATTSSQMQNIGAIFASQSGTSSVKGSGNGRFGRWALENLLPEETQQAATTQVFVKNRPRKKKKNELKEKDLSVQPILGEQHYEYLIRRKQVRAEAQKALVDDVDDYMHVGDDWIKNRLGWLCKEIPVLKASGTVKMLNNQRKWIKQEHLKDLIEHLMGNMELKRAHRVLKWMQQQPFYKFEYELHNNMAFRLGCIDKLSRCQDVFDEIVRNGQFPDASVFTALIKAYLKKGDHGDINDAWKLYKQMLQLELTVSENLSETLLTGLTCPTGCWIRQAEELFVKMKSSGMHINEEMYSKVIVLYGKRGDHKKFDAMLNELRENQLKPTVEILNAKLEACAQNGDTVKAEETMCEIVEIGLMPNWRSYSNLIQVYGKAKLPMQSWEVFNKMKGINIPINFVTYYSIIEAMAADGQNEKIVTQVLAEVEENGIKPLQPCYNSVMNMYLQLKKFEEVELIFNKGKAAKVRPGHVAYNMLMKAYTESGQLDKAEALFQEMKKTEGMGPNTETYNILLVGFGVACFKARVRELFEEMSAKGCQLYHDVKEKVKSLISIKKIAVLEKKRLNLTDEQREIIPGLLLGGAKMISPDRNRTYELHLEFNCENEVKRAIKDRLSFLFQAWWKTNQSGQSAVSGECVASAEEEVSGVKSFVQLETVSHGSFRFYAHQYRPNGEPVIPRLIHRWLKPRTLAYWYMYGGRKCQKTGGIILNASKYSGKQIQLVAKALKTRTMDCRRRKRRNGDVIRFEGRSATWLWKLMEPYILKTVKEQLKPEQIPIDLTVVEGAKTSGAQDQDSHNAEEASSEEDDWEELKEEAEFLED